MTLIKYFKDKPRGSKVGLARKLGISKTWMALIINGQKSPSAALSTEIERATRGLVTRNDLRPDLFGRL